jgi:hypothetical protein
MQHNFRRFFGLAGSAPILASLTLVSLTLVSLTLVSLTLVSLACGALATDEPGDRPTTTTAAQWTPTADMVIAETPLVHPTPAFDGKTGSPQVESVYNENIVAPPAERIVVSEVELMLEALQLLEGTSWDGDADTPLPISIQDFDQAKLDAYVADEISDVQELTIPADLEELYISPQAAADLSALILRARDEYLGYLAFKGALLQYITEIDQNVMPADPARMVYHPDNDPQAPPTATEGLVIDAEGAKDHARLQMNVYPVDIYNRVQLLQESGILGPEPFDPSERLAYQRQLRDMATRQLVYHEMTHVLQRAYVNLHVSADERPRKSAWAFAAKRLIDVDTQYHWRWGDRIFADSNNRQISDESQAEGISYEIFVNVYNLSAPQRQAVWDHFFGRLAGAQQTLNEIRQLCEARYPDFSPDEFNDVLTAVMAEHPDFEKRAALMGITRRLLALPAYVGYMNPMLPQDTEKVWEALRQP